MTHSSIARAMARDQRNIWTTHDRAKKKKKNIEVETAKKKTKKKSKKKFKKKTSVIIKFPLTITKDRTLSIMETVVEFLHKSGMKNQQIATVLNRSRKTVSTVYSRAKEKRKMSVQNKA